MKKIFHIFIIAAILSLFIGCEALEKVDEMPENGIEYSSTYPISGEWYVLYNHAEYGEDPFGAGFTRVYIANTSANDGKEVWIGDYSADPDDAEFWQYKVKIPVNMSSLTFEGEATSSNADYPLKVKITNGQIFKEVSEQPSGVMSDSIYFEIWYEDLEDETGIADDKLLVSGFRRTGFLEDEH